MELGTPDVASIEMSLGIFEPMSDGALDTMNDGTAEGSGEVTLITGAAVGIVVVIFVVGAVVVVVIIVGAVVLLAFSSTPPSSLSSSGRVMISMVSKNKSCSGFNNRPPTRRCR